jgi:Dna[CI] antecedent, DciA
MERLEGQIREELSRFGPQGGMPEILAVWPEAVGPMVVANAWPARIASDGTLHVNTSSSAWAFELGQLAPAILEKLHGALGEGVPKALRFAAGHLPEPSPAVTAETRTEVPEPTAEALETAAGLSAGIEDEELRKHVQRATALGLSRPSSDHRF